MYQCRSRVRERNGSSRSGSRIPARRLRLVRKETFRWRNRRAIVVRASWCPRRRKVFGIFRSERCVHFSPEIGSPAVASRSSSSKVVRTSGLFVPRGGVRRRRAERGRTVAA